MMLREAVTVSTTRERQGAATVDLPIEGMTCGACAARIERGLGRLEGVALGQRQSRRRAGHGGV
jgi:heavy-metal-associated domain-containing protein